MLERFFHLKAHGTCLRNEILAGVTTFLAATGLGGCQTIRAEAKIWMFEDRF